MADFVEVLIGTGMRKGEALGLHWTDVHLDEQVLYVRYALSAINNSRLVITTPKTRSSKNWVAISPRVATALQHQAPLTPAAPKPDDLFSGLVPGHFKRLAAQAKVPIITLHDLRHLAATVPITAGIPLLTVSKTLRHSTLSTTANIYSHLTRQAARDAVEAIDTALTKADTGHTGGIRRHWPPRPRPRPHRDHRNRPHHLWKRTYSPTITATSPTASRPQQATATTMRPPATTTRKRPLSHL
ncbi:site-specific integrase [Streptomyces yatensis]|uniref:Tyr recombinase domain-containing protein n=1 Tax=Streptomyces yatensis TaxID=155177 RepID=A0ABN2IUB3_9ACTN|nr:site-specific integrase [Streptomyces yatensis]